MADLKYVTYCGLYCKQCSNMTYIPQQAKALYNTLKREGFEYFGPYGDEKFNDFWEYLKKLTQLDRVLEGCRKGGCGDPQCQIRMCASEKNQEICMYCEEYPCPKFDLLATRYPTLLGEGKKLKEIGIDAWIEAQEERCSRGYCFADSRYDIDMEQEQKGD
ncbi:MAG: DUF3795 domain-containing protein [Dehalococcoidales bacterium]|nr:MAG: DUF3795 domain-containing protein [Dehalococcoidales bacterium]